MVLVNEEIVFEPNLLILLLLDIPSSVDNFNFANDRLDSNPLNDPKVLSNDRFAFFNSSFLNLI